MVSNLCRVILVMRKYSREERCLVVFALEVAS